MERAGGGEGCGGSLGVLGGRGESSGSGKVGGGGVQTVARVWRGHLGQHRQDQVALVAFPFAVDTEILEGTVSESDVCPSPELGQEDWG